jgi:hypothetical protein
MTTAAANASLARRPADSRLMIESPCRSLFVGRMMSFSDARCKGRDDLRGASSRD